VTDVPLCIWAGKYGSKEYGRRCLRPIARAIIMRRPKLVRLLPHQPPIGESSQCGSAQIPAERTRLLLAGENEQTRMEAGWGCDVLANFTAWLRLQPMKKLPCYGNHAQLPSHIHRWPGSLTADGCLYCSDNGKMENRERESTIILTEDRLHSPIRVPTMTCFPENPKHTKPHHSNHGSGTIHAGSVANAGGDQCRIFAHRQ
jgi:hypothetical protein